MRKLFYILTICFALVSFKPSMDLENYVMVNTIVLTDADILAFPGAVGHGKNATGGRAGTTIYVTNLNNSGSGSFREAVTTAGARIVLFKTGGTITLTTDITITTDDLTIAGETSAGDGIAIYGKTVKFSNCDNIIVKNIRFRGGDTATDDSVRLVQTSSTVEMNGFIFDHCSISWGADENFGSGGARGDAEITNVTVSNSIISETFNILGVLMFHETTNYSYIRNLFAHNTDRNIHASTETSSFEFINNFVYGFRFGTHPTVLNDHDIIGNVYVDGHDTSTEVIKLQGCINNCDPDITSGAGTNWFVDDNTFDGADADAVGGRYNDQAESGTPVLSSGYSALANAVVQDSVLAFSGARARMEGVDALDAHMRADALNGSAGGYVTLESQTTGLPTLSAGTAYTDTDNDGLSDAYETDNGGSVTASTRPSTAIISNGTIIDQSGVTSFATLGYTHLDIFLADLANDWDGFEVTSSGPVSSNIIRAHKIRLGTGGGGAFLGTNKIN